MPFFCILTWIAALAELSAKTAEGASAFPHPLIYLPFCQLGVRSDRFDAVGRTRLRRKRSGDTETTVEQPCNCYPSLQVYNALCQLPFYQSTPGLEMT